MSRGAFPQPTIAYVFTRGGGKQAEKTARLQPVAKPQQDCSLGRKFFSSWPNSHLSEGLKSCIWETKSFICCHLAVEIVVFWGKQSYTPCVVVGKIACQRKKWKCHIPQSGMIVPEQCHGWGQTPLFCTSFVRQSQLSKQLKFTSNPSRTGLLCILWLNGTLLDCLLELIWLDFCSPNEEEEFQECFSKIRMWGKVKVKGSM